VPPTAEALASRAARLERLRAAARPAAEELFAAAEAGDVAAVAHLLSLPGGAFGPALVEPEVGSQPLHLAAACGGEGGDAVVALLLERGADVNAATKNGKTPLHEAAGEGHAETVCLLLERGAALEARNSAGWSALHWAANAGHVDAARALLQRGAEVNARTKGGKTPLAYAREEKHAVVERVLLARGGTAEAPPPVEAKKGRGGSLRR